MPTYLYKAKTVGGEVQSGEITAATEADVIATGPVDAVVAGFVAAPGPVGELVLVEAGAFEDAGRVLVHVGGHVRIDGRDVAAVNPESEGRPFLDGECVGRDVLRLERDSRP